MIPRWLIITQILSLVAIVVMGFFLTTESSPTKSQYPLLAKRLFLEHPNDVLINFTDLRSDLRAYVAAAPEKIGLYFEYLPTGVNINVGANDEFYRASLVKLPVVMRTYKFIEEGKLTLDDVLTVEEKQLNKDFGDFWKRGVGTTLSIRELINLILSNSDNTAFNVLYERVNVQLLQDRPDGDHSADDVYDFLDVPRETTGTTPLITPKNYSSILKSLYFSAYLSYEHSADILQTLTQPQSQQWLRAGVRNDLPVANKIGQYTVEPESLQVHSDCGIIYYPQRPYLLCVMVHSGDSTKSIAHIINISKTVFDFIERES